MISSSGKGLLIDLELQNKTISKYRNENNIKIISSKDRNTENANSIVEKR